VPLDLAQSRRHSRQIALPELGREGQERLAQATAVVVGEDVAATTIATYLAAAGVGTLRRVAAAGNGEGWLQALAGASIVVRSSFDDDAMVRAAVRLAVPAVIARAQADGVDVVAFRKHGPCAHAALDVPVQAAAAGAQGATAVLAGTLAATEALWILAGQSGPRARHLRLALDGGDAVTHEIPWTPECFLCGGSAGEASFS
jgi:hypothetical protein